MYLDVPRAYRRQRCVFNHFHRLVWRSPRLLELSTSQPCIRSGTSGTSQTHWYPSCHAANTRSTHLRTLSTAFTLYVNARTHSHSHTQESHYHRRKLRSLLPVSCLSLANLLPLSCLSLVFNIDPIVPFHRAGRPEKSSSPSEPRQTARSQPLSFRSLGVHLLHTHTHVHVHTHAH
jgi:hypothetical protein